MAKTCSVCGASLEDAQAFCSSCGTKWMAAEPEKKFCVGCGSPLTAGTKFCAKCGMAAQRGAAGLGGGNDAASAAPSIPPAVPASSTTVAPQKQGGGMVKVIVAVLGFFMFVGLLGMGSCVYIAYRAKQKVEGLKDQYENNSTDKYASALEKAMANSGKSSSASSSTSSSDSSSPAGANTAASLIGMAASAVTGSSSSEGSSSPAPELPHWKPYSGPPDGNNASLVPLKAGLMEVGAVNMMPLGDYEAIVSVDKVDADGMQIEISSEAPPAGSAGIGGAKTSTSKSFQATGSRRKVLAQDMASAHEINLYFSNRDPLIFPGTTSGILSKAVFNELKEKGEAPLTYRVFTAKGALTGLISKLSNAGQSGEGVDLQNLGSSLMTKIDCPLRKAEPNDVGFPVILNDKPVELPAIHAVCKSDQDEFHLWILDDAQNPITVAGSSKLGNFRSQLVRISFPEDQPVNHIEQALKQTGHAQVYGINFDFASATIRPQSKPILAEIAKAMKDNPAWKLSVNGHTDNIGGDASNLELSRKRAAAVVTALTTQYHIAANRFTSAGFGESQPIDTNDTIEGRARNRRVELVLQ